MSSLLLAFCLFLTIQYTRAQDNQSDLTITVVNNCPYTVWPAIQPNSGHLILQRGGFTLPAQTHHSFPAPPHPWSGRLWARTNCSATPTGAFACATGDCHTNSTDCDGASGATPATLAQLNLRSGASLDACDYGVSLVDGYNAKMMVSAHDGRGACPVVGCGVDLLATCPEGLRVWDPQGGAVVACKSGCQAYGTDELCCRNEYGGVGRCRASGCSEFFKRACPATYTYAQDKSWPTPECYAPRELKVIFCG
ncbi:hypothetical protein Sjap_001751 [Stephania japonica]|uniref:Thaumatin-like protein n=1 Tax=Stephania japonica TaxID=461633 RepID=A0AAP0PVC8_9MAGN